MVEEKFSGFKNSEDRIYCRQEGKAIGDRMIEEQDQVPKED